MSGLLNRPINNRVVFFIRNVGFLVVGLMGIYAGQLFLSNCEWPCWERGISEVGALGIVIFFLGGIGICVAVIANGVMWFFKDRVPRSVAIFFAYFAMVWAIFALLGILLVVIGLLVWGIPFL